MNALKALLIILAVAIPSAPALAHEGHGTPGTLQAPHGGVVKSTRDFFFELVSDSDGLKIYPMDHDLKAMPLSGFTATATSQAPKKPKQSVKLTPSGDHWEAKVDAQGAYRYTLELQFTHKSKKSKVSFQVEPQN